MTLKIASFFGTPWRTTVETAELARPATILSPYGEGYCKVCRFIEPLDPDGRIEEHFRSGDQEAGRDPIPCKGSHRWPPASVPYRSTLSAFRLTPRKALCPKCGRTVGISSGARPLYYRHAPRTMAYGMVACLNSFERVEE